MRDYQEIRVQEAYGSGGASGAAAPRAILVVLEDDLVDACKAGDDVTLSATIQLRWHKANKDVRCEVELVAHAVSLKIKNKRAALCASLTDADVATYVEFWREHAAAPLRGRNAIIQSVCPQLAGLATVKLAVLLALISRAVQA